MVNVWILIIMILMIMIITLYLPAESFFGLSDFCRCRWSRRLSGSFNTFICRFWKWKQRLILLWPKNIHWPNMVSMILFVKPMLNENNVDIENSYRNLKLLLELKSCQLNKKINTIFMADKPIIFRALLRYQMLGLFSS